MLDIKPGALVTAADGSAQKVISIHPQGVCPVFKVTFSDGTSTRCTGDHLWKVRFADKKTKRDTNWRIRRTADLIERCGTKYAPMIPVCEPVKFCIGQRGGFALHPYTYGVLLGDGSTTQQAGLKIGDPEIVERLRLLGFEVRDGKAKYVYNMPGQIPTLKKVGLYGKKSIHKSIQPRYLTAPVEMRWELLRGLLDTDGWCDVDGEIGYSSASQELADGVMFLARSLGGFVTKRVKKTRCLDAHTLYIRFREPSLAFALSRKKARASAWEATGKQRELTKTMVSIVPDGEEECQCIIVDSPDRLYLCEDFTLTHNSGKGYTIRATMVELHARYLQFGVKFPVTAIMANTYPNLADWQIRELTREYQDWGEVKENHAFGIHFKFHDPGWGVCLLRNLDKPDKRGGNILSVQIDEATLIQWEIIEDVIYACRGAEAPFHAIGLASNPDGPFAYQIRKLFVDRDFSGEAEGIRPQDFHFVQAFVWDNPAATEADHLRLKSFKNETMVKARYYGEWDIMTGLRFPTFNRRYHTFTWDDFCKGYDIPKFADPAQYLRRENGFYIYGGLDFGTSIDSASAFYLTAVDWKNRAWTFWEEWLEGRTLKQQAPVLADILMRFNVLRLYVDPSLAGKDDDGMSRIDKFRKEFRARGCHTPIIEGSRDRIERWATMDNMLHYVRDENPPHSLIEAPQWRILAPGGGYQGCPHLIQQVGSAARHITAAGNKLEDVDPLGGKMHALDGFSYFAHTHFKGSKKAEPDLVEGSNAWMKKLYDQSVAKEREGSIWR